MRYYIRLARFSSLNRFVQIPLEYCSNTYIDEHPNVRIWFFEMLRKSVCYYRSRHDYWQRGAIRLPWGLETMTELIPWLDEQEIFYHYEFTYERANAVTDVVTPIILDERPIILDERPASDYWNYYKYKMMLIIPEDMVAIVKLYFPHTRIIIEEN